jgi:nitrite reductase (NO-forming)
VLKWLPGFRSEWLRPWFNFWHNLQHPYVMFFAYLVAAVETLIAVAVIVGFARKLTYISAATFRVLTWATAEGFRGLASRLRIRTS